MKNCFKSDIRMRTASAMILLLCAGTSCSPAGAETVSSPDTHSDHPAESDSRSDRDDSGDDLPEKATGRDTPDRPDPGTIQDTPAAKMAWEISKIRMQDLDEIFRRYDNNTVPGCAVAVYHNGEIMASAAYGIANLDYGVPISDSTSFYMASVTKQVTAAAAGLLIIRNKLDPDASVSSYLEEWPDWAGDVRVKHLFNHTSGLPDVYDLMDVAGISLSNVMNLDDYISVLRNGESLKYRPGAQFSYTNSGYKVLAKLVEEITGDSFSVFAHREIFRPLGMTATHYHDDRHRIIPNRAIGYATMRRISDDEESDEQTESGFEDRPPFRQVYLGNFQGVGPGGLYSTLRDWRQWEAFWSGHNELPDAGESAALKHLLTNQMIVNSDTLDYGKGLEIKTWQGVRVNGHDGNFMGFRTDVRRAPEFGVAVLTLCNREDADPSLRNRLLLRKLLKEPFETFLKPYEGTYFNEELEVHYSITIEDGTLKLGRRLEPNGFMIQENHDKWRAGSWDFVFMRDPDDQIEGFLISTGRAREVKFIRK